MVKHQAYIGLGTNLGDRQKNLQQALELLNQQGVEVIRCSSIRETAPYGVTDQPDFLNCVCEVTTELMPLELLRLLLKLELDMGRVRLRHWGERCIDLDLLFYEQEIMDTPELKLPHPDLQNRDFVLEPLCELAPEFIHPVLHKTIRRLLVELQKRK